MAYIQVEGAFSWGLMKRDVEVMKQDVEFDKARSSEQNTLLK